MQGERPGHSSRPRIEIRHGERHDRTFVRDLAAAVFSVYGSYGRYLTDWFDEEGVRTLIAEIDQEPVGLAMLAARPSHVDPHRGVAELLAIAVKPSYQSHGVGGLLMQKAIEEAPGLPFPIPIVEIHLSVAEGNARAQRLFARRGFRRTGGEGIYPAGQRALHMVKVLKEDSGA